MTDNGLCYRSNAFRQSLQQARAQACLDPALCAESKRQGRAFIPTALREWAYAVAYPRSDHRAAELQVWLYRYCWHRLHGNLKSSAN